MQHGRRRDLSMSGPTAMSQPELSGGHVVSTPQRLHECDPGVVRELVDGTVLVRRIAVTDGTVWECKCGQRWTAIVENLDNGACAIFGRLTWRAEGRLARLWRLNRGDQSPGGS